MEVEEKKLPKGWIQTELNHLFKLIYGKGLRTKELTNEGYNVYGANGIIGKYTDFTYRESKVIISCRGAASGTIHKTTKNSFITSNSIILDEYSNNYLNIKFVYYAMKSIDKEKVITGTAQPQITIQLLKNIKFPLAPLPEQERIVAKLDKLFGQLEEMKKSLEKIPVLLKNFRQQVLTQAVTGKLTEEWRKGKELDEWEETILINLIKEKPRNGFSPRGVEFETSVKSLSLSATTSGKFDSSKVKYLDIDIPDKDSYLWLKKGDVLIQRSNSLDYVGTSAIYDEEDNEFIYPDIMMKIRANNRAVNKFLNYSLSSTITRNYFKDNATGTAGNMPKINQSVVSNTPINLPPIKEQQEIVNRVESLFAKADAIQEQYEILKTKVDNLPQAILHKAFKGELVPQLDTDGDARDLLEDIRKVKDTITPKKKRKSKIYAITKTELPLAAEPGSKYKKE